MREYTINLTEKEIKRLKRAIWSYEDEIFNEIEDMRQETGKHSATQITHKQCLRGELKDLHTKLSYQLSDQQNHSKPLSQREYPQ